MQIETMLHLSVTWPYPPSCSGGGCSNLEPDLRSRGGLAVLSVWSPLTVLPRPPSPSRSPRMLRGLCVALLAAHHAPVATDGLAAHDQSPRWQPTPTRPLNSCLPANGIDAKFDGILRLRNHHSPRLSIKVALLSEASVIISCPCFQPLPNKIPPNKVPRSNTVPPGGFGFGDQ